MITKFRNLIIICLAILVAGCNSGTDDLDNRQGSQNPFGAQIVVVDANSENVFGNLSDLIEVIINVNEQLTPDGTLIDFQLNSQVLPINHQGCVIGDDNSTSNGKAVLDLLAGLFIDENPADFEIGTEIEDKSATVNVGVTLIRASGETESKSFPIQLRAVRLVAPPDTDLETNAADNPVNKFLTLQFKTRGFPIGTIVEFEISDDSIGDIAPKMVPIMGSREFGQATTQYTSVNETGGVQVVTAKIVLPDPITKDSDCPSIPISERTIEAVMVITQSVPEIDIDVVPDMEDICDDGVDNDGDGPIDCADSDCIDSVVGPMGQICEAFESTCFDQFDNDADGFEDCADLDCNGEDGGAGTCEFLTEATCDDGFDNDGDGMIDCADMDCDGEDGSGSGDLCEFGMETSCADGFDNDGDGDVDGDDTDCP